MNGNTFDTKTVTYGHARKVWRSLKAVYPGGGTISNVSDWVSDGIIPAGTPIKFDSSAKTITAYTDTQVTSADDITTLGINAYLLEDAVITDANTIATGTAVYAGELYEYMYEPATLAKLKTLTTVPQIVWVL